MTKVGIYIFHIILSYLFIYLFTQNEIKSKILSNSLILLSIIIIIYHFSDFIKNINNSYALINLFHLAIVGPILLYVGIVTKLNFGIKAILELLTGGMIFYHTRRLINVLTA